MAGVCSKPLRSGKYQGWFIDHTGKQRYFVGTRSKTQTRRMAERLEDEHRQMRYGYKPLPKVKDQHALCSPHEIVTASIAWGKGQGGRGGRAWRPPQTRTRPRQRAWWQASLGREALGAFAGGLPQVEAVLRRRQGQGRTGNTLTNDAETRRAFCR